MQKNSSNLVTSSSHAYRQMQMLLSRPTQELSEDELLSLIVRTKSQVGGSSLEQARRLWEKFGSLREIERSGVAELSRLPGLTFAKAASIQAALELGRRLVSTPLYRGQSYTSSRQIFAAYSPRIGGLEQENFWVLLLDQQNRVIKEIKIASGSINRCPLTPREVFAPAFREKSVRIVLLHNHPSGDPEPSREDQTLTQRLQEVAAILGVEIIDHLVIADQSYVSFADRGWI